MTGMNPDTLPRGWHHLGSIRKELSGLAGYPTLVHELFQNAEDARASTLTFRVTDTELVVENEKRFSDCRQLSRSHRDCPWLGQGKPSCDFHNVMNIGAGLKADREGVIGKFGVGLLAAYLITDRPEILSGDRHWTFREELEERDRIAICSNCGHLRSVQGTQFLFPYALDDRSVLRKAFAQPALNWRSPAELVDAIRATAPRAMLFLENVTSTEVYRGGQLLTRIEREDEKLGDAARLRLIVGQGVDQAWYLFEGEFSERASTLREQYGDKIPAGRGALVSIAVSASEPVEGLLYAGLPTNTTTGLPFLIDATFFPEPSRKRIVDDPGDYRTEWNLAAMDAAGQLFAEHLPALRDPLGPVPYWNLIRGVAEARDGMSRSALLAAGNFWERTAARVRDTESAYDSAGRWVPTSKAPVLSRPDEVASLPALNALGIYPMDEGLRAVLLSGRLPRSELGMSDLSIDNVLDAIQQADLAGELEPAAAPGALGTPDGLDVIWTEIELLLAAAASQRRPLGPIHAALRACSIALSSDGALIPLGESHRADAPTRQLLEGIGADIRLLLAEMDDASQRPLLEFCRVVDLATLVTALERLDADDIDHRWKAGTYDPGALLGWLAGRFEQLDANSDAVARLKRLRLFPAGEELGALDHIAIPGDFQDPLELADVMTLPDLAKHRRVLEVIGARELTIGEYARVQVPRALRGDVGGPSVVRKVVRVLADHVFDLEGDDRAREALRETPMIECLDGVFRPASAVAADSAPARDILGEDGPLARLPETAPLRHQQLWSWLGVAAEPTVAQIRARINRIVTEVPVTDGNILALERLALYLNGRLKEPAVAELARAMSTHAWLPARGDSAAWHRPTELFAVFQDRLFETQATFLGFSQPVQLQISPLMDALGLRTSPSTAMIVDHLLACADDRRPVHKQVWGALNQAASDPALQKLRGRKCLLLDGDDTTYRRPGEVFRRGTTFGGLRLVLDPGLARAYGVLFAAIGVKDEPDADDAIGVLREIASRDTGEALSETLQRGVYEAWALIGSLVDEHETSELVALGREKTACDRDGVLCEPARLYIEDRPLLVGKFGDDIQRRVVGFDPATVNALRSAGARDFSQVVTVERLHAHEGDTRPATVLDHRLTERWPAIVRVMVALGDDVDLESLQAGPDFDCLEIDDLWVRYVLPDEPGSPQSEEEPPEAIFILEQSSLYVRGAGSYQWRHVARELGVALCGARDAHRVSSYLSEVLRAETLDGAHGALDEFGIARITAIWDEAARADVVATDLGGTETGDEVPLPPSQPDARSGGPQETGAAQSHVAGGRREGGDRERGGGVGGGQQGESRFDAHEGSSGTSRTPRRRRQPRDDYSDEMLRSWVKSPRAAARELDPAEKARREATDRAGVDRALRYERDAGRAPTEMPHSNEGYDIESRVDGELVRYIEVKAQSGPWRNNAPSLSKPQHDHAIRRGELYWLYVVEQAGQPGEEIHVIQDPIGRATHFGFDPGWRDVAFDAEAPYEELEDELNAPAAQE